MRVKFLFFVTAIFALALSVISCERRDREFPSHAIEIIIPAGAGGGMDTMVRFMQPLLQEELGVPIRVSNIPGGVHATGTIQAFSQPADGYTILIASQSALLIDVFGRAPFTFTEQFVPLARMQKEVGVLWAAADGRFQTIEQAIEYARAGGTVTVAMSSPGGIDDASVSGFAFASGVELALVPIASGGERMAAVIGGHVDLLYEEASAMMDMAEIGSIVPLVVFSDEQIDFPLLADIPFAGQFGIYGTDALGTWRSWTVRRDTPPEVQARLRTALYNVFNSPAYQEWAVENGLDIVPGWLGPQEARELWTYTVNLLTETFTAVGRI